MFDIYLQHTFILVLVLSAVPLAASSLCALLVSVVQAATQIQEQSIGYLARVLSVAAVFAIFGDRFAYETVKFFQETIATLAYLGKT